VAVNALWPNFASRVLIYFCVWWLGVELARWHLSPAADTRGQLRRAVLAVAAAAALLGLSAGLLHPLASLRPGTSPVLEFRHLAGALVVLGAALVVYRRGWPIGPVTRGFAAVAPVSYALYLMHEPLGVHLPWSDWIPSAAVRLPVCFVVVGGAAFLAEHYFQPAIRRLVRP
jgi:hypothetical protein